MVLSDDTLKKYLDQGKLFVEPLEENSIQPASIDCRLGNHFLMMDTQNNDVMTLDKPIQYKEYNGSSILLPPHSFCLATTKEYIKLPNDLVAFVEGRSSIGRMGLFIQNAGWVDPGFEGCITLELFNANSIPIKLSEGRRICQLVFCKMDKTAKRPYKGKYQGQNQSMGSKVFMDNEVHESA